MSRHDARWVAKHLGRSDAALFTPQEVDEIAPMLQAVEVGSGNILWQRGRRPSGVWIIKEGWIELVLETDRRAGVVGVFGPLQCVGEIPLILDQPAPYTAVAATDAVCLFMEANEFMSFLRKNPNFTLRWTAKLAGRVARAQGRVVELLGRSLREQVARLLLHESHERVFPFAQDMCAAMLGASRSPVNQVLKELERDGLVVLRYGRIEVIDEPGLAALAREAE